MADGKYKVRKSIRKQSFVINREIPFKKEAPTEPKSKIFFCYKQVTPLELEIISVSLTPTESRVHIHGVGSGWSIIDSVGVTCL
jgi:hypothetical protein